MSAPVSCIPLRSAIRYRCANRSATLCVVARIAKTREVAVTRPPLLRKMAARADIDDVYIVRTLSTREVGLFSVYIIALGLLGEFPLLNAERV